MALHHWYCVQARPRQEFFARDNIQRLGFDTFLPTETRERVYKSSRRQYLAPLFGPYLFVWFNADEDYWRPLYSAYGVRRLFSTSPETPTPVPDHAIESLMRCTVPDNTDKVILPGTKVRVVSGPLAAIGGQPTEGICQWTHGRRVALLLCVMQGKIEVSFDADALEVV